MEVIASASAGSTGVCVCMRDCVITSMRVRVPARAREQQICKTWRHDNATCRVPPQPARKSPRVPHLHRYRTCITHCCSIRAPGSLTDTTGINGTVAMMFLSPTRPPALVRYVRTSEISKKKAQITNRTSGLREQSWPSLVGLRPTSATCGRNLPNLD